MVFPPTFDNERNRTRCREADFNGDFAGDFARRKNSVRPDVRHVVFGASALPPTIRIEQDTVRRNLTRAEKEIFKPEPR